jgi:hypothetical protein
MKKIWTLLVLIVISAGCSSLKVSSDYDKTTDFTEFETFSFYGWAKGSEAVLNRFDQERIEDATRGELEKRGMRFVEKGGDAVVSLFIVIDQKTSTTAYTNHYNMGGYGYRYGWGYGMGSSTTTYHDYDYNVGTLVIDVFSSKSKDLIWQGVGSKTVDENPKSRDKGVVKSVGKIMSQYPLAVIK